MDETTNTAGGPTPEEMVRELGAVLGRRIEEVERENLRLRRTNRYALVGIAAMLGMSAVVVVAAGMGRSSVSAEVVEAERFVLRTPSGETRGEWRMGESGSSELVLQDANGRSRVRLGLLPDGSTGLSFADGSGNSRAALGLLPDQTTSLVFADRTGRTRAVLGYSPDDAITLVFADRSGVTKAGLGIDAAGQANLTLLEEQLAQQPLPAEDEVIPDSAAAAGPVAARSGAPPGPGGR